MKNIKILMIMGLLGLVTAVGSGCSKANAGTENNINSESTTNKENTLSESKEKDTKKSDSKKKEFKFGETIGTIGAIDLEADTSFPKAGFFKTNGLILGCEENKGELASCFYQRHCINKTDAESNWNVEYSEDLEKIPNSMKGLKTMWDAFLEDGRMYTMYSEQQYEVIVDNTEKVTYNGVDFIKEEGHIDVTRKDPSNTRYPELVRAGYIAYYYFSPEGAGSNPADDNQGYGMGMAIWGVRPVDMSDEAEAKTMEENYEKLKKSTKASMETLISLDDYWKIDKKFY